MEPLKFVFEARLGTSDLAPSFYKFSIDKEHGDTLVLQAQNVPCPPCLCHLYDSIYTGHVDTGEDLCVGNSFLTSDVQQPTEAGCMEVV